MLVFYPSRFCCINRVLLFYYIHLFCGIISSELQAQYNTATDGKQPPAPDVSKSVFMLRIQYLDKDRFMRQVAASKGSVYLHLDNGETCDLKKDSATTELFQMMNAPAKGFSISVADPADVTGFLHYMLEAGRKDRAC